ncbi:MAG: NAD(P)H-hydrate dehydratase [Chloroflexota bacterium]
MEARDMKSLLPKRSPLANKGDFGRVMVVAGSINYTGAPYLACAGALRVGAGLVTLAIARSLLPIVALKLTEATYLPLPEKESGIVSGDAAGLVREAVKDYDVLLIGCGMGQDESVVSLVRGVLFELGSPKPALVIDADALNVLAKTPDWWQALPDDAILTPHPGEMARLTGLSVTQIQQDRLTLAKKVASAWHKTVVLKGAYTVVASPEGKIRVAPFANPGLASAGTGDVLAGAIAGLVAQGLSLFDGASLGVYLHGEAGGMVRENLGDAGMLASDLLPALPLVIKKLKEG